MSTIEQLDIYSPKLPRRVIIPASRLARRVETSIKTSRHSATAVTMQSNQSMLTGFVGASTCLLCHTILAGSGLFREGNDLRLIAFGGIVFIAIALMLVVEIKVRRIHHLHFDFGNPLSLDRRSFQRILQRMISQLFLFASAFFLYWLAPEYGFGDFSTMTESWYGRFLIFGSITASIWLLVSPYYFFIVEKYSRFDKNDDSLLRLFNFLALVWRYDGTSASRDRIINAFKRIIPDVRSWFIKFFFLPLMITYYFETSSSYYQNIQEIAQVYEGSSSWMSFLLSMEFGNRFYMVMFHGIFLVDLLLCIIGYTMSMRLIDTHVRSSDSTLLGWIFALACYHPFNQLMNKYISYDSTIWSNWLVSYPVINATIKIIILFLLAIYVYATVSYGCRFSNLTNRGIITKGPYRWIRHPAYVSKNIAWWLMAMPIMSGPASVVGLLGWNAVYMLRALTEEKHLKSDAAYREYCKTVKWRFIPWLI